MGGFLAIVIMILLSLGLTLAPLGVWLGNGHSIYDSNGENALFLASFLFFGLGFLLTSAMIISCFLD